jgi:hypothetical protein
MLVCTSTMLISPLLTNCQQAPVLMNDVLLVGFVEKPIVGEHIGLVEGDDCSYGFFNQGSSGSGKLRKAFDSARSGTQTSLKGTFEKDVIGKKASPTKAKIRYINNVTTDTSFSNYIILQKYCVTVTGKGYR